MDREALRLERDGAVNHLLTLTEILVHKAIGNTKVASFGRLNVEVIWCNGRVLFARWSAGASCEEDFPWHIHDRVTETIGVLDGEIRVIYRSGEENIVHPGEQVVIAEGIEHRVVFEQGKVSGGWLVLVPPDKGILPYANDGCCALHGTSKCAGNVPACLALYRDEVSGHGRCGPCGVG